MAEKTMAYQIVFVLEGVVEIGDPASVPSDQDVPLFVEAGGFGPFEHDPFVEDLHGVDAFRVPHFDDAHLAKGTTTDDFDDLKVVARQTETLDARHHRFHLEGEQKEKHTHKTKIQSAVIIEAHSLIGDGGGHTDEPATRNRHTRWEATGYAPFVSDNSIAPIDTRSAFLAAIPPAGHKHWRSGSLSAPLESDRTPR